MDTRWENRKVLVTGANGFIGSHLVETLLARGARVIAVIRRVSRTQITHNFQNLKSCLQHPALSIVTVDLAGPSAAQYLLAADAQTWFHLAADAYVPASLRQPVDVVMNNVQTTLNVLECATKVQPDNVIITSSSEVYGSSERRIAEDHPLNPMTPYAASKVACDRLAWSYRQSFGTPVTIMRPFNTYGPRHVYDVIPIFIRAALRGDPLTVHGDGLQTRDLTYVTDTVAAFLAVGERHGSGEVFNIGTGRDHTVLYMAQLIKEIVGSSSPIVFDAARKGEVRKLQADGTLLMKTTNWRPIVSFEAGIEMNIEWARRHPRN